MANILQALGWKNSGLHLGRGEWQDYSGADKVEALADPRRFTHRGNVNAVLRELPSESFAVCHLGPRQIRVPKSVTQLVVLRDLRTALPSYLQFVRKHRSSWPDSNGWRTEAETSAGVSRLLELFPGIRRDYAGIADWLPHRFVIFYEALTGKWGREGFSEQLHVFAAALGRPPEEVHRAVESAKASDSLTKSSNPGGVRPMEIEEEKLRAINRRFGYDPDASLARVHLSYAAERKQQIACPLCRSERATPREFLRDRYGLPIDFAQCCACGHLYQWQQPSARWWKEFYEQHYWPIYGCLAARSLEEEARNSAHRYEKILTQLKLHGLMPRKILDVGSGTGGVFPAAEAVFPGCEVLGSDVFPSDNPKMAQVDWQDHGFSCDADLVTSIHSLEHVHEPMKVLANIRNSVSPGHYLYVEVPNLQSPRVHRKDFFHLAHVQYYDPIALRQMFQAAGYRPLGFIAGHVKEWPWTIGILGKADSQPLARLPRNRAQAWRKRILLHRHRLPRNLRGTLRARLRRLFR